MNNLGLIAKNKKLFNEIVKRIGENNKNHIYLEILPDNSFSPEEILKKINLLNDKKVDFIAIDDLEIFDEFEFLQENSPLLILHPIDTLVKSLGRDLNQFPLWILGSKSAKRILELHGYSYQMADKQTKENFEKLKTLKDTEEKKDIIKKEISRYKPYGIDALIFTYQYGVQTLKKIEEIDIYIIEESYIKEIIDILNK